jgi:CIC family chloride channel protein
MGAVVAPVIGAPIAVILVILEFTQSYDMAVLGMIGIVISSWVAHIFYGASFFDRLLLDRGIDLHRGRGHLNLMETPLGAYVHQNYTAFGPRVTVGKAMTTMQKEGRVEAYVVGREGDYIGKLEYLSLIKADPKQAVSQCLQNDALSIKADASLLQAIEAARDFVGESIPVIDRETGAMDGIVSEGDLFAAYLDLQNRVVDIEGK